MKKDGITQKKDRVLLSEVDAVGIDEVREVMTERPEVIKLCLMLKDGISQEDMVWLVSELEAAGVNNELIGAIKLFEKEIANESLEPLQHSSNDGRNNC